MSKTEINTSLVDRLVQALPQQNEDGTWNHQRDDLPEGVYKIHSVARADDKLVWFHAEPKSADCDREYASEIIGCIGTLWQLLPICQHGAYITFGGQNYPHSIDRGPFCPSCDELVDL